MPAILFIKAEESGLLGEVKQLERICMYECAVRDEIHDRMRCERKIISDTVVKVALINRSDSFPSSSISGSVLFLL